MAERMSGQKVASVPSTLAAVPYGSLTGGALRQRYSRMAAPDYESTTSRLHALAGLAAALGLCSSRALREPYGPPPQWYAGSVTGE
jgi:hypothetical protein